MNALELRGLTKHYKDFTLGPLDLTLPGGTICGLIGENGAGKSTTIKLILDMLQRDGGTVTILGRDNRTDLVHTKEEIGVVLGSDGIPLCLNAVEVGKVMAGIYRNWDAGDYTAFCRKFDLPPDKKYKDYSAGMQRKLCIAVALSHHAKLLLLDEATNGLDPVVRDEVVDILLDFARDEEHSILISSHIVSDLEKLCDTIAFLLYGDNVIEKHGINRDSTGDREKTRYLCGKQGIFTRDRALIRPGFIRQLETRASTRSASFFHALGSPGRPHNGGGEAGAYRTRNGAKPLKQGHLRAKRGPLGPSRKSQQQTKRTGFAAHGHSIAETAPEGKRASCANGALIRA